MPSLHFFRSPPLSMWAPVGFSIDGPDYTSLGHYMAAQKARMAGDRDTLRRIMDATDPELPRRLERRLQGLDPDEWERTDDEGLPFAWRTVWRGAMAKFSQNAEAQERLLATGEDTLAYADTRDLTWGIGLDADDPLAWDPDQWEGLNWLGEILMDVRTRLGEDDEGWG